MSAERVLQSHDHQEQQQQQKKGLWIYINVKTETFSQIILCIFMSKELLF